MSSAQRHREREWRPENRFTDPFYFIGPMPRSLYLPVSLGVGCLLILCGSIVASLLDTHGAPPAWVAVAVLMGLPAIWAWMATGARRWRELGQSPLWLVLDLYPPIAFLTWLYRVVRRGDSDLSG